MLNPTNYMGQGFGKGGTHNSIAIGGTKGSETIAIGSPCNEARAHTGNQCGRQGANDISMITLFSLDENKFVDRNSNDPTDWCTEQCPMGSYCPGPTATPASLKGQELCPSGRYGDTTGLSECKPCVAGTFSTSGPGQTTSSVCIACVAGRFSTSGEAQTSITVCDNKCSVGKWSTATGITSDADCTSCIAGRYSTAGQGQTSIEVCQACAAGRYSTVGEGQTSSAVECNNKCRAGKWSDQTGLLSDADCTSCIAGRYSISGEAQTSIEVCLACAAGRYSVSGEAQTSIDVCLACAAGRYSTVGEGQISSDVECNNKCSVGKWSNQTGLLSDANCTSCIAGRYSISGEAKTSIEVCLACAAGRYSVSGEAKTSIEVCLACAAGRYSTIGEGQTSSAVECNNNCSAGKWSTATGITSDSACNGECGSGKWSSEVGLALDDCKGRCSLGKFSIKTGLASDEECDVCLAGQWSDAGSGQTSSSSCLPCRNLCGNHQFFSNCYGSSPGKCISCPAGFVQLLEAQSNCTRCNE